MIVTSALSRDTTIDSGIESSAPSERATRSFYLSRAAGVAAIACVSGLDAVGIYLELAVRDVRDACG